LADEGAARSARILNGERLTFGAAGCPTPRRQLEPGEKPRWTPQKVAILEGDELAALLDRAPSVTVPL
jgi:hypothetical protein